MAIYNPLTGYEPNHLDNFDYSEEFDDDLIGKALSSPLFIQERGESADRRQTYHSHEESFLPAQSLFSSETRIRTKFRFLLRTEIKSRLR